VKKISEHVRQRENSLSGIHLPDLPEDCLLDLDEDEDGRPEKEGENIPPGKKGIRLQDEKSDETENEGHRELVGQQGRDPDQGIQFIFAQHFFLEEPNHAPEDEEFGQNVVENEPGIFGLPERKIKQNSGGETNLFFQEILQAEVEDDGRRDVDDHREKPKGGGRESRESRKSREKE